MKRLAVVVFALMLLMFSGMAYAGACGDFEYAELMDMDQATLLREYCEVRKTGKVYIDVYMFAPGREKGRYKSDADSCMDMMGKMERIYMKRFKIDTIEALRAGCK